MKIAIETVAQVKEEIQPLLQAHYDEIASNKDSIPLDPNYDAYEKMEKADKLLLLTVRTNDDKLVGYSIFFLVNHPHYKSTLVASNDLLFLSKEYRGAMVGTLLIEDSERILKSRGVKKITWHIKPAHDFSPILKRKGYALDEMIYARIVGD